MSFELSVDDGLTPCSGCEGYIDTSKEVFVALVQPDRSLEGMLQGEREGRPEGWRYFRGVNTFHPKCWGEQTEPVFTVTGVGSSPRVPK